MYNISYICVTKKLSTLLKFLVLLFYSYNRIINKYYIDFSYISQYFAIFLKPIK